MSITKSFTINSPIDDATGAIPTIDIVHHEIHEGEHFFTSYYEKIGAASAINILITPGAKSVHFVGEIVCDNPGMAYFCESPNATTSGSSVIVQYNNDRASTKVASAVTTVGGTYTSSGTVLRYYLMGSASGTGGNRVSVGATAGEVNEIILNPSKKYLLRFVADAASTRTIIRTAFYEE
jgi:hypothetical protein